MGLSVSSLPASRASIGTEGFPFTVVVDKQGIVRHAVHGTSEYKRAELLAKIKEADAE